MFFKVVSIFDRAANVFGRPAFVPASGAAIRDFTDEVNRVAVDNQLNRHPEDFDLYLLGDFDDNPGKFVTADPVILVRGKDVIKS